MTLLRWLGMDVWHLQYITPTDFEVTKWKVKVKVILIVQIISEQWLVNAFA